MDNPQQKKPYLMFDCDRPSRRSVFLMKKKLFLISIQKINLQIIILLLRVPYTFISTHKLAHNIVIFFSRTFYSQNTQNTIAQNRSVCFCLSA